MRGGRHRGAWRHDFTDGIAVLTLLEAPVRPIAESDAFTIRAGCDKRMETCGAKFANIGQLPRLPAHPRSGCGSPLRHQGWRPRREACCDATSRIGQIPRASLPSARSWFGTPYHDQASLQAALAATASGSPGASGARWWAPSRSRSRPTAETGARRGRARCWPRARGRVMIGDALPADAAPGSLVLFRMMPRAIAKHVGILTGPDSLPPCLRAARGDRGTAHLILATAHRLRFSVPATLRPRHGNACPRCRWRCHWRQHWRRDPWRQRRHHRWLHRLHHRLSCRQLDHLVARADPADRRRADGQSAHHLGHGRSRDPASLRSHADRRQHHLGDGLSRGDKDHHNRAAARVVGVAARSRPPNTSTMPRSPLRSARGRSRALAASGPTASCWTPPGSPGAGIRATKARRPIRLFRRRWGQPTRPPYRGTAYVVFEDLPLGNYGNRIPQLSFEVFRRSRIRTPRRV